MKLLNISTFTVLTLYVALFLQLIGLTIAVCYDSYISKEHRRLMLIVVALVFSLVLQNHADSELSSASFEQVVFVHTLASMYGYIVRPIIIVLFIRIVDTSFRKGTLWAIAIANALIYSTATFSPISFSFSERNLFHRGPLGYTCVISSMVLIAILTILTIRRIVAGGGRGADAIIPILNIVFIIAASFVDISLDFNPDISMLNVSMVSGCIFYYIWLHLQFVREHEDDQEAQQRIRIMISQIQPHFMFNTLSTIQALCLINPQKAADTVEKFGTYLRQNLDSLNQEDLIPFERELEHTRVYSDIENVRFSSISVEYDIHDTDFSVPALTVQPLVENAIRHGVRYKKDGYVVVRSYLRGDFHEIIIEDNGKGFEESDMHKTDRAHIGVSNVRERIEKMCEGTVDIDSKLGQGTSIIIRIPASTKSEDDE